MQNISRVMGDTNISRIMGDKNILRNMGDKNISRIMGDTVPELGRRPSLVASLRSKSRSLLARRSTEHESFESTGEHFPIPSQTKCQPPKPSLFEDFDVELNTICTSPFCYIHINSLQLTNGFHGTPLLILEVRVEL